MTRSVVVVRGLVMNMFFGKFVSIYILTVWVKTIYVLDILKCSWFMFHDLYYKFSMGNHTEIVVKKKLDLLFASATSEKDKPRRLAILKSYFMKTFLIHHCTDFLLQRNRRYQSSYEVKLYKVISVSTLHWFLVAEK